MQIYSQEQLERILRMTSARHKRRFDKWCIANKLSSNSVCYSQFSTPLEMEIVHFCNQYLIKWYGESFSAGKVRNKKALAISKRLKISRSQARLVVDALKVGNSRRRRVGGSASDQVLIAV